MFTRARMMAAAAMSAALVLSACDSSSDGDDGTGPDGAPEPESKWANCSLTDGAQDIAAAGADADKEISIATLEGWGDSSATAQLLKTVLEQEGYTVTLQPYPAEEAFGAVADGTVDLLTDAWLPGLHEEYADEHSEELESLGCWYGETQLAVAVNESSPATSLDELADDSEDYNTTLVGIDPDSPFSTLVEDSVIPAYGLDEMAFSTTSTPVMLSALKAAQSTSSNIAVTLWHPHWAYETYGLRDLEDPEETLGGTGFIYNLATKGFGEQHPVAAQLMKNLVLDEAQVSSLQKIAFSPEGLNGQDDAAAVAQWLSENPNFVAQLKAGQLS